jgi:hypothetical protein
MNVLETVSVPEPGLKKAVENALKVKYYRALRRGLAESGNR